MSTYTLSHKVYARAIRRLLPGMHPDNIRTGDIDLTYDQYSKVTGRTIDPEARIPITLHLTIDGVDVHVGGDALVSTKVKVLDCLVAAMVCAAYPANGSPAAHITLPALTMPWDYGQMARARSRLTRWSEYMYGLPALDISADIWPSKRARRHYITASHQVARSWRVALDDYLAEVRRTLCLPHLTDDSLIRGRRGGSWYWPYKWSWYMDRYKVLTEMGAQLTLEDM